jgi:hypothetical protein
VTLISGLNIKATLINPITTLWIDNQPLNFTRKDLEIFLRGKSVLKKTFNREKLHIKAILIPQNFSINLSRITGASQK